DINNEHSQNPSDRKAQKRLAYEVTKLVHGDERARSVEKVSNVLFTGSDYTQLGSDDIAQLEPELPFLQKNNGDSLVDSLVESGLAVSKTEARRFLGSGAIYINGQQANENNTELDHGSAIHGYIILRRGKNAMCLAKIN